MKPKPFFLWETRRILLISFLIATGIALFGQEEVYTIAIHSRGLQRVGNTFESIWLIDNQTVMVPLKKTTEFDILHRFGTIQNGYSDLWGLYAPSNIRLGFNYVPINNLQVGFGFTKERLLWDFNIKYAIVKQPKEGAGSPVSVTYFGNAAVETRPKSNYLRDTDRLSYFHQLMVARKVTRDLSVQAAVSLSHFNTVEASVDPEANPVYKMNHDHVSVHLLGRYKISDAFAFIGSYDQPITRHPTNNPKPNLAAGVEVATPLHAFQVFLGNTQSLVPQYSQVFNKNDFKKGAFVIGFNITRLLDLQEEDLFDMMFKRKGKGKHKKEEKH